MKPNRMADAAHRRDVPKRERNSVRASVTPPLVDPVKTLGHPARGRKRR